jgi:hypothetical protein
METAGVLILEAESTPGPQFGWKDQVNITKATTPGIEPAPVRIVAWFLNQLR